MKANIKTRALAMLLAAALGLSALGCGGQSTDMVATADSQEAVVETEQTQADAGDTEVNTAMDTEAAVSAEAQAATITEELTSTADSEHVIEVSGESVSYENIKVVKTGDSDAGDEADFYGDNAAIFATDGATLTLSGLVVDTDGTHANAVFSYGEGTTVTVTDSVITTAGNCSGGLMTTGGGTMIAEDLAIHTTGNSSAAIRSDRGGGTVDVTGGTYVTDGTGSPVIYSTADITVRDAVLTSTASQGVVVEGQNSVTLSNVTLTADNNTKNSDKSAYYQAVMIYQSMSGDADEGLASFVMNGGSLINKNGDIFFVNNTVASITMNSVSVVNEDADGVFLRAEAAGWGSEGSNGGKVDLTLTAQELTGDMVVDEVSALNLYLTEGSDYTGAIGSADSGEIYVEIQDGSTWTLTGDSYITALSCAGNAIDLNGYTLYVGGTAYEAGTESTGSAIVLAQESSTGSAGGQRPEGAPPTGDRSDGEPPTGDRPEGEPPTGDRPEGELPTGDRPEGEPPTGDQPESDASSNP